MNTKHFFWLLVVLILGILLKQKLNKKELYKNYVLTSGRIVNYESWKFRKVEFLIDNIELEERATMSIPFPSCGDIIYNNLSEISQIKFPVIYSSNNKMNHEIMIYNKQYESLGISVPDSLKSIVNELSNCFNQRK